MKVLRLVLALGAFQLACAAEVASHRLLMQWGGRPAGRPDAIPVLLTLADKPLQLSFEGVAADWKPEVSIARVTDSRKAALPEVGKLESCAEGSLWSWTPPRARGPIHYELRFKSSAAVRIVRVETRDEEWFKAALEMLRNTMDWEAVGLSKEERKALLDCGWKLGAAKSATGQEAVSLTMTPREQGASRRRVVWDERDADRVVWRSAHMAGDIEVRAPRWWISAEALATTEGLIRIIDLFTEPPIHP